MKMKWYVLYTKPHCEKQVANTLARKKIAYYFPTRKVGGLLKRKAFEEPLLPCYLFVRVDESQHIELMGLKGVINFVFWLGNPVVVKDLEIEMMQRFLCDHINISIKKITPGFSQVTKYNSSILEQAPLISIKSKTAKIVLSSLGYVMTAEVETLNFKVISKENLSQQKEIHSRSFNPVTSLNNFLKN